MKDSVPGYVRKYTYIGGDAYTAPVVAIKTNSGGNMYYYLLRDHLGSITHVVTTSGALSAEYSYDAWGRMRNPSTWTNYTPGSEPALIIADRGFTGHEHLPWFKLINMNGRLYDPLTGQFLSADKYVQNPAFTQNYNRYTYCLNNPLRYNDASGNVAQRPDEPDFVSDFRIPGSCLAPSGTRGVMASLNNAFRSTHTWETATDANGGHYQGWVNNSQYTRVYSNGIWYQEGIDAANNVLDLQYFDVIDISTNNGSTTTIVQYGNQWNASTEKNEELEIEYNVENLNGTLYIKNPNFFGAPLRFTSELFTASSYYFGAINIPQSEYENYIQSGLFSASGQLMAHEFGHYLTELIYGRPIYYNYIAPTSLINFWFLSTPKYDNSFTEVLANTMSYFYFNCPQNWNTNMNPINLDLISGPTKGYLMEIGVKP